MNNNIELLKKRQEARFGAIKYTTEDELLWVELAHAQGKLELYAESIRWRTDWADIDSAVILYRIRQLRAHDRQLASEQASA